MLSKSTAPSFMMQDGIEQEGLHKQRRDLLAEISESRKEIEKLKKMIAEKELVQEQEESLDLIVAEKTGDQDSFYAQQKLSEYRPQVVKLQTEMSNLESQFQDFQRNHSDDAIKKLRIEIAFQKGDITERRESLKQLKCKLEAAVSSLKNDNLEENKCEVDENKQRMSGLEAILKELQKNGKLLEDQYKRKQDGTELREENASQLSSLQQKYEALRKERIQKHQQLQEMTNDQATQKSMMRTCASMKPQVEHSLFCDPRKRREHPPQPSRPPTEVREPPAPRPKGERRVKFVFDVDTQNAQDLAVEEEITNVVIE